MRGKNNLYLWIIILSLFGILMTIIAYIDNRIIETTRAELYCGSRYFSYDLVYNESLENLVVKPLIGIKCCKETKKLQLNEETGEWIKQSLNYCSFKKIR